VESKQASLKSSVKKSNTPSEIRTIMLLVLETTKEVTKYEIRFTNTAVQHNLLVLLKMAQIT
jgi:hypothetical protein